MRSTSGRNRWRGVCLGYLKYFVHCFELRVFHHKSHLLVNLFHKMVVFVEYIVVELLYSFVIELLLLMFEFEVWVYCWALLLLY